MLREMVLGVASGRGWVLVHPMPPRTIKRMGGCDWDTLFAVGL